jgi:voltage-gated potassium channel Kch
MKKSKHESLLTKHFMAAMVVFLILIAVQTFSLELLEMSTWLKVLVTILPVLPLIWAFFIFRARYRALDEYMKALTGEAFLWMIGILCFSSFIYGMLAMKFPLPPVELALVMPVVFGGHGLILHLLVWKDNG